MIAKKNRIAAILCLVGFLCAALLFFLPTQEFLTDLYTKKSGNTFPGDERYVAARAEAEAALQEYLDSGIQAELSESQLLRETSKGTTSLMTFTISRRVTRSAFDVMKSGLAPSGFMIAMAASLLLSFVLMALGLNGGLATEHRFLPKGQKWLRRASAWFALFALLLVPLCAMSCNYQFNRAITLFGEGSDPAHVADYLPQWDKFLFGGAAGDSITDLLSTLTANMLPLWWLMLAPTLLMLLSEIVIAMGGLRKTLARGALYAFVIIMCIVILYPFFVMVTTGFRTPAESTDMYFTTVLPSKWQWSNLVDIAQKDVFRFMGNSILLSTGATLLAMLCGIPAAYAMSRMKFAGRKVFLGFIIMSQMFSPVVLLVGISKLMNSLNLSNNLLGLVFINAAFNQAFAIWLLRGVFVSISSEMEQAACIDGCGTVGSLVRILLPMAAPGIVTALIFVFINAWNEYTISTVLITNRLNKPITVGITEFSSYNMIEWHYLFAAAFLATIPVVILFMCIEKHLVSGLTSGGVKG